MEPIITRADESDLPEILSLQYKSFQQEVERYGDPEIPPVHQSLKSLREEWKTSLLMVLKLENRITGSVRACFDGPVCRIGRLFVDPDKQGRGLGRCLVESLEEICLKQEQLKKFEIFTGEKSLETIGLYSSLGYRIRENKPAYPDRDFYNLVFMEKSVERAHTSRSYNLKAKNYENRFTGYEPYRRRIQRFAAVIKEGAGILDLGCGPGQNSQIFAENGLIVHGLDLSREMIRRARLNCPGGDFRVGTAESIPWEGPYDGICLSFLIVHLKDSETASLLKNLSPYSRAGCRVYISFMSGKTPGMETTSFSDEPIYFNYYSPDWIKGLMEGGGFILLREESAPYEENDGSITSDHFLEFLYAGLD